MVTLSRFPPAPHKRFSAFGFGFIISNDEFQGVSILMGFWQLNVGFFESFITAIGMLAILFICLGVR